MSISHEEARTILDADYRPPVKRGDLPQLGDDVDLVGIIDGVFLSQSAVGHREIVQILKRGVTVVGGGSMGALRAAELQDLGMKGVGRIFEMYRDGVIEGDDEVALVFDPETFQPLSEPLVNLRYFLAEAVREKVIGEDLAEVLLEEMRTCYYPRRNFTYLIEVASDLAEERTIEAIKQLLDSRSFDLKRSDSLKVLYELREWKTGRDQG